MLFMRHCVIRYAIHIQTKRHTVTIAIFFYTYLVQQERAQSRGKGIVFWKKKYNFTYRLRETLPRIFPRSTNKFNKDT